MIHDERYIQQCAKDLILEYGVEAEAVAEKKMRDLIDREEAKEASLWLAVLYEIHRSDSQKVH